MVTVRGKKRNHRRGTVNKTNQGKHRKKQYQKKHRVTIQNEVVRKNWDNKKTVRENFKELGLVSDPNEAYKTTHHKKVKPAEMDVEEGDIQEYREKTEVVKKLEEKSKETTPTTRHFSPGECELWEGFVGDHGTDYKAMARDKRNTHQHTPAQIRRKITSYLSFKSSEYKTRMGCVG